MALAPLSLDEFRHWLDVSVSAKVKERLLQRPRRQWSHYRDRAASGFGDDVEFLAFFFHFLDSRLPSVYTTRDWWSALAHYRVEREAVMAGLVSMELTLGVTKDKHMERLAQTFDAGLLEDHVRLLLAQSSPSYRFTLYHWLVRNGGQESALDFRFLADTSAMVREEAARNVARLYGDAHGQLCEMLNSETVAARIGAAKALTLIKAEETLAPLRAALEREHSGPAKKALEEAIASLVPPAWGGEVRSLAGVYEPRAGFEANLGLTELRGLVYEGASLPNWVRICNLVTRFQRAKAGPIAVDYLSDHGIQSWLSDIKPRPWGEHDYWSILAGGHKLRPERRGRGKRSVLWWAPIDPFFHGDWSMFMDVALRDVDWRAVSRRFRREDVPVFVQAVEKAWGWCAENGVCASDLEVKVDGGRGGSSSAYTTTMSLFHGYGVLLSRNRSPQDDTPTGRGLRCVRVKIPRGHPLRLRHGLDARRRALDLMPLLGIKHGA